MHARFDLSALPPKSAAARQHSLCVYHQVQQWKGMLLDPTKWKLENCRLKPVAFLQNPIPPSLLHIITCNCHAGCDRNCECRGNRFNCTNMCGYCAFLGCSNQNLVDEDEEEDISQITSQVDEIKDKDSQLLQKRRRK